MNVDSTPEDFTLKEYDAYVANPPAADEEDEENDDADDDEVSGRICSLLDRQLGRLLVRTPGSV